jgi:hypothetical protein
MVHGPGGVFSKEPPGRRRLNSAVLSVPGPGESKRARKAVFSPFFSNCFTISKAIVPPNDQPAIKF